jgi:uncharacterized protein (DUF305 family)
MMKRSPLAGAAAVAATSVLMLSGCSNVGTEADSDQATHEPTSQAADGAKAHNDADTAFARDMIPHHEQAVTMSDIVLAKRDIDPRVIDLANQIKAAQGPEIATMRGWLDTWGAGPAPGHEGHDMSGGMPSHEGMGMMTDQELEQLRQAQGVEAARMFLTGMIAHHQGAVRMAQTEVDTGKDEAAVQLADEIIETQQREIDTMKGILGSL